MEEEIKTYEQLLQAIGYEKGNIEQLEELELNLKAMN